MLVSHFGCSGQLPVRRRPTATRRGSNGAYGDPNAGDPIQYDSLRIEHDQGDVEIVVYDRAILLFTTDSETVRRIQQVCCRPLGVLPAR